MCTSCRAVGYWFPDEGGCADCRAPMTEADVAEARADGYRRGDVCAQCRADARLVVAVLRGEAPAAVLPSYGTGRRKEGARLPVEPPAAPASPIGEVAPPSRPVQLDLFLGAA